MFIWAHFSDSTCVPGKLVGPEDLELELTQTLLAQKPMLRVGEYAHALRARQNVKRAEVWWAEVRIKKL